ncbi:HupE/UreJ family protein [Flaviflagellibacter deserti]|uniref:HupE/UreJ family protein n=1 Tax=Flaviflagellibacter deserti TaxID=2267266 RepID=A0ABV9Z2C2_9HYPH
MKFLSHFPFLCLLLMAAMASTAAHEVRPALLDIREEAPGEFSILFKTPMQGDARLSLRATFSGRNEALTPMVERPTGDAMVQSWQLRAIEPLAGQRVLIDGLQSTMTEALVRAEFQNGNVWTGRLTPAVPSATIPEAQSKWEVIAAYLRSGVEHILFGFDHLLFVTALMMIVRDWRILVKTITAFTVAHSITLTLASLKIASLPSAPVEGVIALSILLVATEIARKERGQTSLTVRWPWAVAFAFGLLHGFGFAGALADVGLPGGDIPLALFSFNLGVEIGQLIYIAAVLFIVAMIRRVVTVPRQAVTAVAYGIGTMAAFWTIERLTNAFL